MTNTNTVTEARSVVVEREMPFPPEKIWRALTQPHLTSILRKHKFEIFYGVPYALKLLAETDEGIALLASLALVVLGVFLIPNAPHSASLPFPALKALGAPTFIWGNWLFPALLFLHPTAALFRAGRAGCTQCGACW